MTQHPILTVDIWSDFVCPYCYIGKRHFERALEELPFSEHIQVEWHSYQLDPNSKYDPNKDYFTALGQKFNVSADQARAMTRRVGDMAAQAGLVYNFEQMKTANTFDAHRVLQLAKSKGLADTFKEQAMKAHFTDGELLSDHPTLIRLAVASGLAEADVAATLSSNDFADDVRMDIHTFHQVGGRGVPHFLLDQRLFVSGAQPVEQFVKALSMVYEQVKAAMDEH